MSFFFFFLPQLWFVTMVTSSWRCQPLFLMGLWHSSPATSTWRTSWHRGTNRSVSACQQSSGFRPHGADRFCCFLGDPGEHPEKQANLHRDARRCRDEHGTGEIPGGQRAPAFPVLWLLCLSLHCDLWPLCLPFRHVITEEEPSSCLWPEEKFLKE